MRFITDTIAGMGCAALGCGAFVILGVFALVLLAAIAQGG